MIQPVFSIATPARNALTKLRRCIGSVRGQVGISYEHVVQDAASSDGSPQWLAAQVDPAMRARSEPDNGMYDAIDKAWRRSSGQYLSWLNADEQLLPGTLARVQAFFDSNPGVDAVFGDYLVVDDEGCAVAVRREIPLRKFYVANTFLYAQSCTVFYRRRLWDRGLLRLDTRLRYAADKDLVLRLLLQQVKFVHLPEVLALFGVDGSNLSTHPGMQTEAEAVRLAHGGFRWPPLRVLASGGRRLERLMRGAYRPVQVCYDFALDEVPNYTTQRASRLGGRYSLSQVQTGADRLRTAANHEKST